MEQSPPTAPGTQARRPFNLYLHREVRARLQEEAAKSGISVSQMVQSDYVRKFKINLHPR